MSVAWKSPSIPDNSSRLTASYLLVWRWHFYAGLFRLPFIAVPCLSGRIYLFKPQIDADLDRSLDNLIPSGEPKTLDEQVAAAMAAGPGARLKGLERRTDRADAARVHVMTAEGGERRVLVRPETIGIIDRSIGGPLFSRHSKAPRSFPHQAKEENRK